MKKLSYLREIKEIRYPKCTFEKLEKFAFLKEH